MSNAGVLYAEFTDDATVDIPFECRSGRRCKLTLRTDTAKGLIVMPGQPRFTVETPGPSAARPLLPPPATPNLEAEREAIRRQNIEGRLGDKSLGGQIAPIGAGLMAPPAIIPQRQSSGSSVPQISVPNQLAVGQLAVAAPNSAAAAAQFNSQGYSSAHASYGSQYSLWGNMAYSGLSREFLTLNIGVRHKFPGKPNGVVFGTINEGKNISARATASEIIQLVLEVGGGKLAAQIAEETASQFVFNTNTFVVRQLEGWINIHEEPPHQPLLYHRYLKLGTGKKQNTLDFHRPARALVFVLVIPYKEWQRFLNFQEEQIEQSESKGSSINLQAEFTEATEPLVTEPAQSKSRMQTRLQRKSNSRTTQTAPRSSIRTRSMQGSVSDQTRDVQYELHNAEIISQNTNDNSISADTPSKKRSAESDIEEFQPLDRQRLRNALNAGGASVTVSKSASIHTSETIEFFRIRPSGLQDLLRENRAFKIEMSAAEGGTLALKPSASPLGVGTFKSAHSAYLTLTRLSDTPLGASPGQHVALKRMFRTRETLKRFDPVNEYEHTISEANLLFWGTAILRFTMGWIHNFIGKYGAPPDDLPIFNIRFVEAGIAMVHEAAAAGSSSKTMSSLRRTYLLEELIGTGKFVKYINNNSATPVASSCASLNMFNMSKRMVLFFSLTCKIMTSPSLDGGLFGGGNYGKFFEQFPEQHVCSRYWHQRKQITVQSN
ncbi:unnamed protein product [Mycena citricolor]|uniref:Uncharacterized protein n=1 Tax=Mycena citricolor TaxID=2018698 RepID=A0AAD2HZB4_9AGAR|nr:unnamed protein product [Mycena citricolor]